MRWDPGLFTNPLAFTLQVRKNRKTVIWRSSDEESATNYRHKWGPLPQNKFGRIAHHVKKGEERKKEGKGELGNIYT